MDGERWGLTPLNDQHVAGAIMGLEQSLVMGIGLAWLFARMLAESDRADEREERSEDARARGGGRAARGGLQAARHAPGRRPRRRASAPLAGQVRRR